VQSGRLALWPRRSAMSVADFARYRGKTGGPSAPRTINAQARGRSSAPHLFDLEVDPKPSEPPSCATRWPGRSPSSSNLPTSRAVSRAARCRGRRALNESTSTSPTGQAAERGLPLLPHSRALRRPGMNRRHPVECGTPKHRTASRASARTPSCRPSCHRQCQWKTSHGHSASPTAHSPPKVLKSLKDKCLNKAWSHAWRAWCLSVTSLSCGGRPPSSALGDVHSSSSSAHWSCTPRSAATSTRASRWPSTGQIFQDSSSAYRPR